MRVLTLTGVIGAVLLAACTEPSATFDTEDPAVIAVIDSLTKIALEGSQNADADQVLAFAEGVSELSFITADVMLTGLETIRSEFAKTYEGIESQTQTILQTRTRLVAPDVAIFTATSEGTYTDNAGWTSDLVGIGHTLVFVREDGTWRLTHAHQSIAH